MAARSTRDIGKATLWEKWGGFNWCIVKLRVFERRVSSHPSRCTSDSCLKLTDPAAQDQYEGHSRIKWNKEQLSGSIATKVLASFHARTVKTFSFISRPSSRTATVRCKKVRQSALT